MGEERELSLAPLELRILRGASCAASPEQLLEQLSSRDINPGSKAGEDHQGFNAGRDLQACKVSNSQEGPRIGGVQRMAHLKISEGLQGDQASHDWEVEADQLEQVVVHQ